MLVDLHADLFLSPADVWIMPVSTAGAASTEVAADFKTFFSFRVGAVSTGVRGR